MHGATIRDAKLSGAMAILDGTMGEVDLGLSSTGKSGIKSWFTKFLISIEIKIKIDYLTLQSKSTKQDFFCQKLVCLKEK